MKIEGINSFEKGNKLQRLIVKSENNKRILEKIKIP